MASLVINAYAHAQTRRTCTAVIDKSRFRTFFCRSPMSMWTALWLVVSAIVVRSNDLKEFQFKHHSNEEMYECMLEVHEKCPAITSIYRLSENSVEGRPLLILVLSIHPNDHKPCTYL